MRSNQLSYASATMVLYHTSSKKAIGFPKKSLNFFVAAKSFTTHGEFLDLRMAMSLKIDANKEKASERKGSLREGAVAVGD